MLGLEENLSLIKKERNGKHNKNGGTFYMKNKRF